ncbi:MAG: hypothetical protein EA382_08935 [Spirochaetaceae bacterium]|nr:MAG: hypothetical protein EA382_08935 [Spirochaetaceae bacterium]
MIHGQDSESAWWTTHPWRLIQTNLREIDMADIDADEYVRQLIGFDATIAMINVGGIIASYPTDLDDHFQSPYLGGDSLERIIDACHAAGIRVIARTDFSKIRRPVYDRHPDWAFRTAAGDIVDYNGDVHACLNGGYQQVYAKLIIQEIVTKLAIDGIFFNMGGFVGRDYSYVDYGACHCDACAKRFRDEYGHEIPPADAAPSAVTRAFDRARRKWGSEHRRSVHDLIKGLRRDVAVDGYDFQRQESNTEIDRPLPRWQYDASSNTRWVRTSMPETISSNTSVDFIGFFYRHVAVSPAQQELRLWQNLANGGGIDYYLIGRLDNHRDRSGFDRIRTVFQFHRENQEIYRGLVADADVLLVRSSHHPTGEERGWIRFLTEGHFAFAEALVDALADDADPPLATVDLSRYRCVVLPDLRAIPDGVAVRIDRFVADGGVLIATGLSGTEDADREPRARPLPESLGVERIESVRTDMRSAMFEVRPAAALDADGGDYPSLTDTDLLFFGDTYVYAHYSAGGVGALRLIPPHPYGPPERCYYAQITDRPGYVVTRRGAGRSIYLPWLPGALFHREGYVNTSRFIYDLLTSVAGVDAIATNAPPMVEITVQRPLARDPDGSAESCVVSLTNASGHFASTVYDAVELRDIRVTVAFDGAPTRAVSLRTGRAVRFDSGDGRVTLHLDTVGIAEVVRIVSKRATTGAVAGNAAERT